MSQPERSVVVVTLDLGGRYRAQRYTVMSDGERVLASDESLGGVFLGRMPIEEYKAAIEESIHRRTGSSLPVDVEFVEVETLPSVLPKADLAALERYARIGAFLFSVTVGAIWPSLYRRAVPNRKSWKRLLRRGIAGWAFSNFVKETVRRRRCRAPRQPRPRAVPRSAHGRRP